MNGPIKIREVSAQPAIYIAATCAQSSEAIGETLGKLFPRAWAYAQEQGLTMPGPPFVRYTRWADNECGLEAGMPVTGPASASGEIQAGQLGGCTAAAMLYTGPYTGLCHAHDAVMGWIRENGREMAGAPWESYLTDPGQEPDAEKWQTEIFFPVR